MLVIVVTHNLKYLKRYRSGFLKLENGNLVGKWIPKKQDKKIERKEIKKKKNDRFIYFLARKNIKKNRKRNIISSFSAGFSFLLIIISTFFNTSISNSKYTLINSYVNSNSFSVSEISYEEIEDSPLKLMNNKRPKYNDVYSLLDGKSFLINYSYDYFFSDVVTLKNPSTEYKGFVCRPIYSDYLNDKEVIINKRFYESYIENNGVSNFSSPFSLYIKKEVAYFSEYTNKMISDTFEKQIEVKILDIVDEFRYMNEPTLYYPIQYIDEIFKETEAPNSSLDRGEFTSFYNLIEESKDTDEIGDYSYYIFALDAASHEYAYKLMESFSDEDKIQLENFGYTMTTSFISLTKTIFLVINILIFIALAVSLFICGFLAYSSSLLNRKESAILSSLGASKNSIYQIYVTEQSAYSILGIVLGILFSLLIVSIINLSLKNFFITSSFIKVDPLTIIIYTLVMALFEIIVAFIPLKIMKKKKIYEELKEE
ncbi:MAG: ABC transporter permease [Bacilli bacterium]|nr:ABC transporter permease [Bacilli bacterium]